MDVVQPTVKDTGIMLVLWPLERGLQIRVRRVHPLNGGVNDAPLTVS